MAEFVSTYVPRPTDFPQPNLVRFSDRAREGLERANYKIFPLTETSLGDMTGRDSHPLRVALPFGGSLRMLRSVNTEVAIDPVIKIEAAEWHPAYVTDTSGMTRTEKQRLRSRLGTYDFKWNTTSDRTFLEDVDPWLGGPADYAELAMQYPVLEVFLFGDNRDKALMTNLITLPARKLTTEEDSSLSFLSPQPQRMETLPARVAALNVVNDEVVLTDFPTDYATGGLLYAKMKLTVRPLLVPSSVSLDTTMAA
jgi:hypothetical protein